MDFIIRSNQDNVTVSGSDVGSGVDNDVDNDVGSGKCISKYIVIT